MTKEEKNFCERCSCHKGCGFVIRGLEGDCRELDIFSGGFEAAVNKTLSWLEYHVDKEEIESYKEYMEE